ncbi:hypothetical protein [Thermopirellula anaerolimosa]
MTPSAAFNTRWIAPALAAVWLAVCGCTTLRLEGKSPLLPPKMSPQSVVLDIFFLRIPANDAAKVDAIWRQADEQRFAREVRDRWSWAGFRVGLLSGQIPPELAELMRVSDEASPLVFEETKDNDVESLTDEEAPVRRHIQTKLGNRVEVIASETYDELPFFRRDKGKLVGCSVEKAQGMFALTCSAEKDGRIRLRMVPEIHHGDPHLQPVGGQGVLRLESRRDRQILEELACEATMSPGDMLLVSCLPDRRGSLGDYFLTTTQSGKREQKLLVIRLSQTQQDPLFDPQKAGQPLAANRPVPQP